jgi:hypothetical protein
LLLGLLIAPGLNAVVADTIRAQTIAPCDVYADSCDCPGCRAFLQGCAPQDLDCLPPVVTREQGEAPYIPPSAVQPEAGAMPMPSLPAESPPPSAFQPGPSSLAASLGGAGGGAGLPSMIGDFFGGGYNYQFANGATVATAGGDRRFKFADNNNPFPQDRFFFNYHHFNNALVKINGGDANLDRFTFGLEKTVFSDRSSIEVRIPFGLGLGGNPGGSDPVGQVTEFGNIALAVKHLLVRGPCSAVSAGLGIVLPTGDDFSVGGDVISNVFQNDAIHLLPFIGAYHDLTPRLFTQFFAQLDFDANGNDVIIGGQRGVLQDQTLLFLDQQVGYWLYRNGHNRYLRGVAPMVELHYTTTLQDQDYGPFLDRQIFVQNFRRDVFNITGGLFFQLGPMSSLKIGGVAPLRTGDEKQFDSELGVQFTRRY